MIKPFDARVIVKKPERQEQTESGIILPDTVSEQGQTAEGIVVDVGPGFVFPSTSAFLVDPFYFGWFLKRFTGLGPTGLCSSPACDVRRGIE